MARMGLGAVFLFAMAAALFLAGCPSSGNGPQACPADAKLCPDGSAVGRTGPNCTFAPCPPANLSNGSGSNITFCTEDAKICPDGSGVGRVGPDCHFAPCPGADTGFKDYFNSTLNLSCDKSADCALVNSGNGFSCCWLGYCEAVNFSEGKWIAVNEKWYNGQRAAWCPSGPSACGPAPGCPTRVINQSFEAVCTGSYTCAKVQVY